MTDKASHEKEVLTEFLNCLLPKNLSFKIESKSPPEPDLLVKMSSGEQYYELGRILDKNIPPLRLEAVRKSPEHVKVDPKIFGLPERDIVESKLQKTYETNKKQLNLLLYYDEGFLYGGIPPIELNRFYSDIITPLLERNNNFNKIYIFDRLNQKILWEH